VRDLTKCIYITHERSPRWPGDGDVPPSVGVGFVTATSKAVDAVVIDILIDGRVHQFQGAAQVGIAVGRAVRAVGISPGVGLRRASTGKGERPARWPEGRLKRGKVCGTKKEAVLRLVNGPDVYVTRKIERR